MSRQIQLLVTATVQDDNLQDEDIRRDLEDALPLYLSGEGSAVDVLGPDEDTND